MPRPSTCRTARLITGALSMMAAIAWSAAARAQEPPPAPAEAVPPAAGTPAPPPAPPPGAQPAFPPPVPQVVVKEPEVVPAPIPPSDFDVEARRWAIGYAGVSQVPLGLSVDPNTGQVTASDLTVPAVGIRYWASSTMGVDLGIGISYSGGSRESTGTTTDKDGIYGVIVQGGLPFALATYRHVSFQLVPYAAIAHGQTKQTTGAFGNADVSGTRFEVGARTGFELFFGFIGVPELALSATVGLRFEYRKYSASSGGLTDSDTSMAISTTVQNSPWDIFAGNVAARYYF